MHHLNKMAHKNLLNILNRLRSSCKKQLRVQMEFLQKYSNFLTS